MSERPRPGGGGPEDRRPREPEGLPYSRVARFRDSRTAGQAYFAAQDAVFTAPATNLSVYRLILNQVYHVAVLGQLPPRALARHIERALASGEPVTLPQDVMQRLASRRAQHVRNAPWSEGHYRPGKPLP